MTLIELIAAMAVAALVLLGAVLLLNTVSDSATRLQGDARAANDSVTSEHMVRRLLSDASQSDDSNEVFAGSSRDVAFWTRCMNSRGWTVRCRSALALIDTGNAAELKVSVDGEPARALRQSGPSAYFEYFDVGRERWRSSWTASATMPAALAIVTAADTAIYPVGAARE